MFKHLIVGFFVCSLVAFISGCGGKNDYSPDYSGGTKDFNFVVYNASADGIGDGTGSTANDQAHPFGGAPGDKMAIIVKSVGTFSGQADISVENSQGQVVGDPASPASINVPQGSFAVSEVSYSLVGEKPRKGTKAVFVGSFDVKVTTTLGSKIHKVYVNYDTGDFKITVYNADAETVGNGQGFTPNSVSNPFTGGTNSPMTVVVEPLGPFTGVVSLSAGQETGGLISTQPNPSTVSITPTNFGAAEFSYDFGLRSPKPKGETGESITITATSGSIVHTYFVNIQTPAGRPQVIRKK